MGAKKETWKEVVIFGLDLVQYSLLSDDEQVTQVRLLWSDIERILGETVVEKTLTLHHLLIEPFEGLLDRGDGFYAVFLRSDPGREGEDLAGRIILALHVVREKLKTRRFRCAIHVGRLAWFETNKRHHVVGKDLNFASRLVDLGDHESIILSREAFAHCDDPEGERTLVVGTDGESQQRIQYELHRLPLKHGDLTEILAAKPTPSPIRRSENLQGLLIQQLRKIEQGFLDALFECSTRWGSRKKVDEIHEMRSVLRPRLTIFYERVPRGAGEIPCADPTDLGITFDEHGGQERRILGEFPGFEIDKLEGPAALFSPLVYGVESRRFGRMFAMDEETESGIAAMHGDIPWETHQHPVVSSRGELLASRNRCPGCEKYKQAITQLLRDGKLEFVDDPLRHWQRLGTSYVYLPVYARLDIPTKPIAVLTIDTVNTLRRFLPRDREVESGAGDGKSPTADPCDHAARVIARKLLPELAIFSGALGTYLGIG